MKKGLQLGNIIGKKDSASFCKKLQEILQVLYNEQPTGHCDVFVGPLYEDDHVLKAACVFLEAFNLAVGKREGSELYLRPTSKGLVVAKRLNSFCKFIR